MDVLPTDLKLRLQPGEDDTERATCLLALLNGQPLSNSDHGSEQPGVDTSLAYTDKVSCVQAGTMARGKLRQPVQGS